MKHYATYAILLLLPGSLLFASDILPPSAEKLSLKIDTILSLEDNHPDQAVEHCMELLSVIDTFSKSDQYQIYVISGAMFDNISQFDVALTFYKEALSITDQLG